MNSKRREYSYTGELMAKATPIEEFFENTMKSKGNKVERRNNKNEKIDYIVNGYSFDVKNDTNFGKTKNLLLEWEYLFFKIKKIHKCWGNPECKAPKAKWLAFYNELTKEFWIYNEEKYLDGFWKTLEDEKAWIHLESTDTEKSTINFIFPKTYIKPQLIKKAIMIVEKKVSEDMKESNEDLNKLWKEKGWG